MVALFLPTQYAISHQNLGIINVYLGSPMANFIGWVSLHRPNVAHTITIKVHHLNTLIST